MTQKFALLLVLLYAKPAWVSADNGIVTKVIQKCALGMACKWIQFLLTSMWEKSSPNYVSFIPLVPLEKKKVLQKKISDS